jgi:acyl-CoA dehydrogenase
MADRTYLDWPFFDDAHRAMAGELASWRDRELAGAHTRIRSWPAGYVAQLGAAGWLKYAVPRAYGGALDAFDVRSICLIRETLGYASGLAEFAFAMQGSAPVPFRCSDRSRSKEISARRGRGNVDRRVCDLGIQCRLGSIGDADHRPA